MYYDFSACETEHKVRAGRALLAEGGDVDSAAAAAADDTAAAADNATSAQAERAPRVHVVYEARSSTPPLLCSSRAVSVRETP